MPITPYLNGQQFDPETKRILGLAFEMTCAALHIGECDDGVIRPPPDVPSSSLPLRLLAVADELIDRKGPGWAQDIPNIRPVTQRRFAMRLVSFILFSVIALASSAPSAFAAKNAFGRASLSNVTCPANEGYPDCQADGSVPHSLTPKRS